MSEKIKREKFVTPEGVAVYPHLVRPDTKFDSDGVYTVQIAIESGAAQKFIAQLEAARDKFAKEFAAEKPANKAKVKKATIYWPSGRVQTIFGVPVNRRFTLVEPL